MSFEINSRKFVYLRSKNVIKIVDLKLYKKFERENLFFNPKKALIENFEVQYFKKTSYNYKDEKNFLKLDRKLIEYLIVEYKKHKSFENLKLSKINTPLMKKNGKEICLILQNDLYIFHNDEIEFHKNYKNYDEIIIDTATSFYIYEFTKEINFEKNETKYAVQQENKKISTSNMRNVAIPGIFCNKMKTSEKRVAVQKICSNKCHFYSCIDLDLKYIESRYGKNGIICVNFEKEMLSRRDLLISFILKIWNKESPTNLDNIFSDYDALLTHIFAYIVFLRSSFKKNHIFIDEFQMFCSKMLRLHFVDKNSTDESMLDIVNRAHIFQKYIVGRIYVALMLFNSQLWTEMIRIKNSDKYPKLDSSVIEYFFRNSTISLMDEMIKNSFNLENRNFYDHISNHIYDKCNRFEKFSDHFQTLIEYSLHIDFNDLSYQDQKYEQKEIISSENAIIFEFFISYLLKITNKINKEEKSCRFIFSEKILKLSKGYFCNLLINPQNHFSYTIPMIIIENDDIITLSIFTPVSFIKKQTRYVKMIITIYEYYKNNYLIKYGYEIYRNDPQKSHLSCFQVNNVRSKVYKNKIYFDAEIDLTPFDGSK